MEDINYWLSISPFELSENDQKSVATRINEEWTPHTWDELKAATMSDDGLSTLTRWPTDMRRYILWRCEMKNEWPDISSFVATQRLGWPRPTANGFTVRSLVPFSNPADYCVRRNDWPYAVERNIGHMVVWLRTPIDVDESGDPTIESRRRIDNFVDEVFRGKLNVTNSTLDAEIIWFKNRTRWQSVKALEHFHVLTKGVDDGAIEQWTGQKYSEIIGNAWISKEPVEIV